MGEDRWGVSLSAPDGADAVMFDDAVMSLCLMRGQPSAELEELSRKAGDWAMVRVFQAYFDLYAQTAEGNLAAAARLGSHADVAGSLDARERFHLDAARLWLAGDLPGALQALGTWLHDEPRDLLALRVAQDLAFFLGDQDALRAVPAQALSAWGEDEIERGLVLGMLAFGLEEQGLYRDAESLARAALDYDPTDPWSTHALAHVMEMEGRADEGVDFLTSSAPSWSPSFFASHNWWHLALFLIELDRTTEAIELLRGPISAAGSDVWFEIVNQASLHWRLWLIGVDAGDPSPGLVTALDDRTSQTLSVFNALHAVAALSLAGRSGSVDAVVAAFEEQPDAQLETRLLRGFAAFGRSEWQDAAKLLATTTAESNGIGGSNAQRDLIYQTLLLALVRCGGSTEMVEELIASHPSRWSPQTTRRLTTRS